MDLRKIVDRKAGVQEMQEALSLKANARDLPSKDEVQECLFKVDRMQSELAGKVDTRCNKLSLFNLLDFEEFEELLRKKLDEHQSLLVQKSNIKDVCALLDSKSSKLQ
jgi:hypothetical protein